MYNGLHLGQCPKKETVRIWILSQQISGLERNSLLIRHPCFHHGLGGPKWPLMNSQSPELNPIVDLGHRKAEPQSQPPMTRIYSQFKDDLLNLVLMADS